MIKNNNLYELLKMKEIILILNGDKKYGEYALETGVTVFVSMPYLSGPDLCDISKKFGLPISYSFEKGAKNLSRRQYLEKLFEHCIMENKCSDLLAYLFGKDRFKNKLQNCETIEFEDAYEHIIKRIIQEINVNLYHGGNELKIVGTNFYIDQIGNLVKVHAPKIKKIDREYIKDISERANKNISDKNYDSAITKSRTLLEEVFIFVIEKKDVVPISNGDIGKLFKQVRDLYNMHTDSSADKRINKLLSGLNNIVSAIAEMRNVDSDAHGVGEKRIEIEEHHARLIVNSSVSMADFILSVESKLNK